MSNRLQEIQDFLQQAPHDPFIRYALAMEYKNLELFEEAHQTFTELETLHPDYVASYLMHGNLLVQMKKKEQAKQIFQQGILQAKQANHFHALKELHQANEQLSEELDAIE